MSSKSSIRPIKLVAVSGAPNTPSKTESLIDAILAQLKQHIQFELEYVKLSQIGHLLNGAASRDVLATEVQDALTKIEAADALIVASPIYRASYTGLFKHLFDYIDQFALVDKPVLLAATGGSERHALTIDHQFRPLFSFFQAQTLPIGVFATDKDFEHYQVTNQLLLERIQLATTRAVPQFLFSTISANNALNSVENNHDVHQSNSLSSQQTPLKHVEHLALLA